MKRVFSLWLMIVCSGFFLGLNAKGTYQFTHLTKENSNLSNNGTRTILQDTAGNIWIGTYAGLSRFDGKRFINYDRVDFGVQSDYISCLAEDNAGNVWIGTDFGVVIYDSMTGRFSELNHSELATRVFSICKDNTGNIWVGTREKGLFLYDGSRLQIVPGTESLTNPYRIKTIDGEVIIADYCKNVYVYKDGALRPLSDGFFFNDNVEGLSIRDVPGGQLLYVASKTHGICEVALSSETVKVICPVASDQRPIDVSVAGEELYISTTGGMMVYDFGTGLCEKICSNNSDPFSLSNDYVRFCFVDKNSSLWVGTDSGGLNYFNKSQTAFKKYYLTSEGESLEGCRVRGFSQTPDGRIWIATERTGLMTMDTDGYLSHYDSDKLPQNLSAVCTIGEDLILGTLNGAYRLNPSTGEVFEYPQFVRNGENIDSRILCLYVSSEETIFAGCSIGVMRLISDENRFDDIEALSNIAVEDILEDREGRLWIASYSQGAFCYNLEEDKIVGEYCNQKGNGPVHDMTSSLMMDANENVWVIGYTSGFFRHERPSDSFTCYDTKSVPQLPTNLFYRAAQDSQGRIWLTCDSGIVEFNPDNEAVSLYTRSDGLLSNDFTKAYLCLRDGSFLFGSIDGFVRFYPDSFPTPVKQVYSEANFWKANIWLIIIIVVIALTLAIIVSSFIYSMARKADKKRDKIREAEREAESYREKLSFFSGVIHEIKTPLTLLRTPLQGLLASGSLSEDQKEDLQVISNSTNYLDSLVKELLEFIRVEEHGYVLNKKNEDIIDKVKFIFFNFKEAAKTKNIKLEIDVPDGELITAIDGKSFTKIVNNLIDNAIKYGETFAKLSVSNDDEKVYVKVENDGPQIPRSRRISIFKPFVRYDALGHEYSQSFGIGLSLARTLAELHDGTLTLSEGTDITEFVLSLPFCRVEENLLVGNADEEINSASSFPLLLVVEDNTELSSYIKRKLQTSFRVLRANSAEQAIELLGKYKIDLMMTDIGLIGMNGVELCKYVSSSPSLCHIPIIVVSAISSNDVKVKCMENGATAYIEKPFSMDFLEATIKSALEKKKYIKAVFSEAPSSSVAALPDRNLDFIRRFDNIVMENISNSDFTMTQVEERLFLSHSSLNRKVKELLNTTPSDYIRDKRLSIAAQMLSEHKVQISEVCYAVGFSSSSYFAKTFKAKYGKLPMEYMEEALAKNKSI